MSYPSRRHHVGGQLGPAGRAAEEPKPPPTITEVGIPPAPLPPEVAIVDRQGKPTMDYYQWQMRLHDWRMKLFTFLGGSHPGMIVGFAHGEVSAGGTIDSPAGFTVTKLAVGHWRITHPIADPDTTNYFVVLTPHDVTGNPSYAVVGTRTTTSFEVKTYRENGQPLDVGFAFLLGLKG